MAQKLQVVITGDSRSFDRALRSASRSADGFGSKMRTAAKLVAASAVAMGAAVTAGFVYSMKRGFDELAESQKVMAQTAAVLKSTGGVAKVTAKDVEGLASSLSRMSGIDDEAIQANENLLLTFKNVRNEVGKGNAIFDRATKASLDLSTAGFGSLDSAAKMLGKALNDPIKGMTAMGRAGVTFSEDQKKAIKALVESGKTLEAQKLILQEVESQVGGSAKAYGETLPGQLAKARNAFDEMAGRVAARFLPALTQALQFVNDNWGTISRVMDTAAAAVERAVSEAADAIRRNWDTIKSIGLSTFDTVRSAGERFVSFMRTSFGQQLAAGALATFGLVKAVAAIGWAVGKASRALMLLKANPYFLALIPLGLAVGSLTQRFVEQKLRAADLDAALRRAGGGADALKAALDRLNQANLSVEQAQLNAERASRRVTEAHTAWQKAIRESGLESVAAKARYDDLRQALLDQRQADLDLTTATKEQRDAQRDRNAELSTGQREIMKLRDGMAKANETFAQKEAAEKFATAMGKVEVGARATALKLAEIDPAASRAKAKTALLADVATQLALKLGRVPSRKELAVAVKAENFPAFYRSLLELETKIGNTKDDARTKGAGIGTAVGQGMAAGIQGQIDAVATQARKLVNQAIAAAKFAGRISSPSKETEEKVGKPLADGILRGFLLGSADLPTKMSEKLRDAISKAQQAVSSAQGSLNAAFSRLAGDAMRAFDAATDAGLRRLDAKLAAKLGAIDSKLAGTLGRIEKGRAAETPAERALRQAEEGMAAEGRQEALSDAQRRLAEAQAGDDPEAVLSAQRALRDAEREIALAALREQAEIERRGRDAQALRAAEAAEKLAAKRRTEADKDAARDKLEFESKRDRMRRQHEDFLALQESFLEKQPEQWRKAHRAIMRKFKEEFGPDLKVAGKNLGEGFAKGLTESLAAMESAAEALAKLIAKYLKSMSPTEKGPLSTLDKWGPNLVKTYAKGITGSMGYVDRALSQMTAPTMGGVALAGAGMAAGGRAGGSGSVNVYVNVEGNVRSDRDLADAIAGPVADAMARHKRGGGSLAFQ